MPPVLLMWKEWEERGRERGRNGKGKTKEWEEPGRGRWRGKEYEWGIIIGFPYSVVSCPDILRLKLQDNLLQGTENTF